MDCGAYCAAENELADDYKVVAADDDDAEASTAVVA